MDRKSLFNDLISVPCTILDPVMGRSDNEDSACKSGHLIIVRTFEGKSTGEIIGTIAINSLFDADGNYFQDDRT